ncbi:MAG TPA: flagellar protein [Lachnospiraceae bacterium]|jgi:flagellar operon protein|nr:flagellar protein [Lachnospiraceae bacterium]HBY72400.1 flagellar protein [Lachnospiraceae bacterium]HCA69203.1 flagellar protein [Lachnospiraceae bacterium]HCM14204.1 flagellar protein [Lachnospiraceae bacterium]HCR40797.1 flagellar protein [Lachnospiraceae bacterium]
MNIPVNQFPSIEQMTRRLGTGNIGGTGYPKKISPDTSFQKILEQQFTGHELTGQGLKFSKHAYERLASRNIDLTKEQLERLETGAKKAFEKGINESLVMVDNLAFIVNIQNNTVITAVNDGEDKVFTNIDGAVVI